jgi:protein phosphatase
MMITVTAFGRTDTGLVRDNNEDNFAAADLAHGIGDSELPGGALLGDGAVLVVADGMGGLEAGEVASKMTVDLVAGKFIETLRQKKPGDHQSFVRILRQIVQDANRSIFEAGRERRQRNGMGSTLTAAVFYESLVYFAQVGDSRAYLLRNGRVTQMTQDQSLVASLIASGSITPEQAKSHPQRNVILQALGVQPEIDAALTMAQLRRGDGLVLCSDGLWGKVEPEEIREFFQHFTLPAACESLVNLARERGGEDNITILAAKIDGDGLPEADPADMPSFEAVKVRPRRGFWPWRRS